MGSVMISSPFVIMLSVADRAELTTRAHAARAAHRDVLRARIVLGAADGATNTDDRRRGRRARRHRTEVAETLLGSRAGRAERPAPRPAGQVRAGPGRRGQGAGLHPTSRPGPAAGTLVVRRARPRSGRPGSGRRRSARPRCAAGWPPTRSNPGSTGPGSSPATPTSPSRPAGCSTSTPAAGDGEPLGDDDYVVISADEKPGVQARHRMPPQHRHPVPDAGRCGSSPSTGRGGTLAYLAAYDVHHAQVIGHCAPSTGIAPFTALVEHGDEPRALRQRPAGVLGRRQRLLPPRLDRRRPAERSAGPTRPWSTLPVHASWLNQIEIYFSIVQRKLLTPDDFANLDVLAEQLTRLRSPLQRCRPTLRLAIQPRRPQPTDVSGHTAAAGELDAVGCGPGPDCLGVDLARGAR